jgi:iron-sulfur cluster repair protein YtfE (RIC family)
MVLIAKILRLSNLLQGQQLIHCCGSQAASASAAQRPTIVRDIPKMIMKDSINHS